MDSDETTDHELRDSDRGRPKRPLSPQDSAPPSKRRRSKSPLPPSTDVSMRRNTISAGHTVNINIGATGSSRQSSSQFTDIRKLADWLSPLNHHAIHKDICEKVTNGTGSWILEDPKFIDWLFKETGVLWGTGIPGAGKTCLTSIVIEHLIRQRHATVIFIYCQYNDRLSTTEILACILKQMIQTSEEVAQHVSNGLYAECKRTKTSPSKSELLEVLREAVQLIPNLFLVVDALDELADDVRPDLINGLLSLQQPLFMTSRPLFDFPGMKEPDFTIKAPDDDLHRYISTKIASFPRLELLLRGPRVREEIITKIHARCNGMFLLATLQVDALVSARIINARGLQKAIEDLPTSLRAQYELTVERIKAQQPQERDLAWRVIVFVTHATRILRVDELLDALTVDLEMASVERECRPLEELLMGVCMGLVTIEKETRTVQLIHYTAHDFFRGENGTQVFSNTPVFSDPHAFIADISAIYIIHADIGFSTIFSKYQLKRLESFPFLHYAYYSLDHHMCQTSRTGERQICTHIYQLLRKQPNRLLPLPVDLGIIERGQAIHFAAFYGLEALFIEGCIENNQNSALEHSVLEELNAQNNNGHTPLHYAAMKGRDPIVRLFLNSPGIDVNPEDTDGGTPLHYAAKNGHELVVQLLLNSPGIEANPKETDGRTPLHYAAMKGHDPIVRLLLNSPAIDVNPEDTDGGTPLHYAAENGHESVIRLLLGSPGIEVNPNGKYGRTPLHCAAMNGHGSVVQRLLNFPAIEVNPKDENTRTPLHCAAENGHEFVVILLLNSPSIDPNPQTEAGRTPLHYAAWKGHKSVVQILLNSPDTEVNSNAKVEWTPLHYAAENGHEQVVQLLLNTPGVEANPNNQCRGTPLHHAAINGHESVVRVLLNSPRVEVNSKAEYGSTPLHEAARNGHESVVQLFLQSASIEVNSKTTYGSTPLHRAAEKGHEPVVRLLLNSFGIEVNLKNKDKWTPLHYAAQNGHEAVVRTLLGFSEVDAHAKGPRPGYTTPLDEARLKGHRRVVALFEEMGV